jgi:hypothetical protein
MRAFKIAEISAVDRPAQAGARITIRKHDESGDDDMATFTKAEAESEWNEALAAYAVRNKLTKSTAAIEFSNTTEAKNIYSKILRAQPDPLSAQKAPLLSKAQQAVSTMNVTCEELAKAAFPNESLPVAVTKFLETPAGAEFYGEYLVEKRDEGVR